MVLQEIDTLELELRKLAGVRTVGFNTSADGLYIQLFIDANAATSSMPFEATRIAKRHSNQTVAVELVRATFANVASTKQASYVDNQNASTNEQAQNSAPSFSAGTIGAPKQAEQQKVEEKPVPKKATHADFFRPTGNIENDEDYLKVPSNSFNEDEHDEEDVELNLPEEENLDIREEETNEIASEPKNDRIELLLVSTSPENDEIEIHLSLGDTRTIGRAPSNRGLLGAIDATVSAIAELTGVDEFHGEWARSLEPGAEHASLVAVGLINEDEDETRHGIAGGTSPIEAAARATLNALNRIATLTNA